METVLKTGWKSERQEQDLGIGWEGKRSEWARSRGGQAGLFVACGPDDMYGRLTPDTPITGPYDASSPYNSISIPCTNPSNADNDHTDTLQPPF